MLNVYPVINYAGDKIVDISKRFAVLNIENDKSKNIYFWHTIQNWKAPENIAYDFYGSCDYVWVILALNNIVNPFEDWLFSDEEIKQRIKTKYGSKMHDVHHYEKNGILYTSLPESNNGVVSKITNYEYEILQNEKKRTIKVLYPHLLPIIEKEVKGLFI